MTAEPTTEKLAALNQRAFSLLQKEPDAVPAICHEIFALTDGSIDAALTEQRAYAHNTLAWHYILKADYVRAIELAETAETLSKSCGYKKGEASAAQYKGVIFKNTGDYSRALEQYFIALAIDEEARDENGQAVILNSIGSVYLYLGRMDDALKNHLAALAIQERIGDEFSSVMTLNNIGIVYAQSGNIAYGLEFFLKALAIAEKIGDKVGQGRALGNIGFSYLRLQGSRALEYFLKAQAIFKELGDEQSVARGWQNIGSYYATPEFAEHNYGKAVECFLKAIEAGERLNAKQLLVETYQMMADAFEKLRDLDNFSRYYKKYHALTQELVGEQTAKKIENLQQERRILLIEKEREVTERLLLNVLPEPIAKLLKNDSSKRVAEKFPAVSVLFADIVNFTALSSTRLPEELVEFLDDVFSIMDKVVEECEIEKIKTIGDAYMAVSGVPFKNDAHCENLARAALKIRSLLKESFPELQLRIGIHTGEAIAGVIGKKKFSYDLWGDTVNTAARMEYHGEPDKIHCTEEVFKALEGKFEFEERGEMEIKGKGRMKTYFLIGEK